MWDEKNNYLRRVFTFDDFKSALEFTNKVGQIAEDLGHHPMIRLKWGQVVVVTTTHDAGNKITDKDRELAKLINEIS